MKIEELIKGAVMTAIYLPANEAYKKPILADLNEMIDVNKVDGGYKVCISYLEVTERLAKLPTENIERIFKNAILSNIMAMIAPGWAYSKYYGLGTSDYIADVFVKFRPADETALDDFPSVDINFLLKVEK